MPREVPPVDDPRTGPPRHRPPQHDTADTAAILAAGIAGLRPRLQLVIDAVFFDGQRQSEVATTLGVTDARVSQMLGEAVRKLRAAVLPQLVSA